ncbi:MAG: hypothetical protein AAF656_12945, partial [Planctomycetota bacterium]
MSRPTLAMFAMFLFALLGCATHLHAGLHAAADDTYLYLTVPTQVETADGVTDADMLIRREQFQEDRWRRVRQLAQPALGLAVWKGDALVLREDGTLRLIAPGRSTTVNPPEPLTGLMQFDGQVLGRAGTEDEVTVYAFDNAWVAVDMAWPGDDGAVSAEFAGSRYVFTTSGNEVSVTAFDSSGQPLGGPMPVEFAVTQPQPPAWPVWLLLAMLAATAWGTMSLRGPMPPVTQAKVAAASTGRRFFAGMIDVALGYPVGSYLAYHYGIDALPVGTAAV